MNKILFLIIFLNVLTSSAFAAPDSFVYEGLLLDSSNVPITTASVLTLSIYNPSMTCLLYEEQQTITPSSNGSFSVLVGSATGAVKRSVNDAGLAMVNLFSPSGTIRNPGSTNCTPGYSSVATDTRKLRIAVNASILSPAIDLTGAPFAMTAGSAEKLGNYGTGDLLRIDLAVDKTMNANTDLTQTQYDEFWRLVKNPNTAYLKTTTVGALAGDVTGTIGANTVTKIQGVAVSATAPTANQVLTLVGSTWTPITPTAATGVGIIVATLPLSVSGTSTSIISISAAGSTTSGYLATSDWNLFNSKMSNVLLNGNFWVGSAGNVATSVTMSGDTTMSNSGNVSLTNSGVVAGTYTKLTVDAKGRATAGASLSGADVGTALGYAPLNRAGDVMIGNLGLNPIASDPGGLTSGDNGKMWYRTDLQAVRFWNGSSAQSLGTAGVGISMMNGLTSSSQTFVTGTAGADFNIASTGGNHIFNIPTASSSSRGALSIGDWTNFNNKMSSALGNGKIWVGNASGVAQGQDLSGDATLLNTGVMTVNKTTTGQASKILSLDGTGVANVRGASIQTGTGTVALLSSGTSANYSFIFPATVPTNGQFMMSDAVGQMTWASTSSFATATTAAMIFYVRNDGSDSACNGTVNASSASAPNCAFLTLQGALDKTPDILKHTVDIRIATPLASSVSGRPLAVVNKLITAIDETIGPLLVIEGFPGAQTLTNALAGVSGILVPKASRGVYLKNLNFNGFTSTAVDVDGGVAILESVAFNNNNRALSVSRGGMGQFAGTANSITLPNGPSNSTGIEVSGGRASSGNLTINTGNFQNNRAIEVSEGEYSLDTGGVLSISESGVSTNLNLIEIGPLGKVGSETGSTINLNMNSSNTQSYGIYNRGGALKLYGITILNNVAGNGVVCDAGAHCEFGGAFRIQSSFSSARYVTVKLGSHMIASDDFQILSSVGSIYAGIDVFGNSSFVYSPITSGKNLTFSAGITGSSAVRLNGASIFSANSPVAFTTTFGTGFTNIFSLSANSSADFTTAGTVNYSSGDVMQDASSSFTTNSVSIPISRRTCPGGTIAFGRGANAFCMELSDNASAVFYTANTLCSNKGMKLCSVAQYGARCATANYTAASSWAQEATSVACTSTSFVTDTYSGGAGITTSSIYRCCL